MKIKIMKKMKMMIFNNLYFEFYIMYDFLYQLYKYKLSVLFIYIYKYFIYKSMFKKYIIKILIINLNFYF